MFLVLLVAYTAIALNFDQPFVSYAFASAIIFLFVAHAGPKAWIATVITAVSFSLCHKFFPQAHTVATSPVSLYAGMLGRGALLVLGWRAIWASPPERSGAFRILLLPVGIVSFVLASMIALNLIVLAHLRLLDLYLYVFDGSLGFQPSFALGRLFMRYKAVAAVEREIYSGLPLAIAAVSAGYLRSSPWRPLGILASAGVLGYLLYFLFPAAGPLYIAGPTFPGSPHTFAALGQIHLHPLALPMPAPPNAIPSLHVAWVLLLWFNCRPFSRIARGFALAFVVLTAVATLGIGEHYFADLVVALPFAVAVQALWTKPPGSGRPVTLAAATGLTLLWLVALRFGANFFLVSPAVPWTCVALSTIISLLLERRLQVSE